MTVRSLTTFALLCLLLAACNGQGDAVSEEKEPEPAIPVEVSLVERGDIYATWSGTAAIEPWAEARVVAKVAGEIRAILVEEGDRVTAGQLLARLDGDRLRLELAQSEARLQKLRRDFQRNRDLRERSLISEGDFEKIQYEMEALEASYNLARLELSYTEIRAPIDGVISERLVKTGNTIEVGAALFQVTSLDPLVAYLHVPEREYRRIRQGMPASLRVDALREQRFPARIARVSPVVDPASGTFKITVEVDDDSEQLKPGMFARVDIVSDLHENALQVPRSAIIDEAGEMRVFVTDGETAERRQIRTGFTANGRVEVLEGITDGDRVIVVGQTGLRDGSRVEIINRVDDDASAVAIAPSPSRDDS